MVCIFIAERFSEYIDEEIGKDRNKRESEHVLQRKKKHKMEWNLKMWCREKGDKGNGAEPLRGGGGS